MSGGAPLGYWCPVLHAHLPFVRHPDQPHPLEEDWLFEAITESYVPLVSALDALVRDGVEYRLTLTLTPTLLSMLADPLLVARYRAHLDRLVALAEREVLRTRRDEPERLGLAQAYLEEYRETRHTFRDVYGSDLIHAFRRHRDSGRLEILTSAATHAFLPLIDPVPESVRAQVQIGADITARLLGASVSGVWLPECAYHPGHEVFLKEAGLGFSFLESHGLTNAHPRPSRGVLAPIVSRGGIVFFGRDPESSRQVWSSEVGYPGDPVYREFYRDIGWELPVEALGDALPDGMRRNLGIKYHRVTGKVSLAAKEPYDREAARARTREHARDFVQHRLEQIEAAAGLDRPPLIVSPYDAELFGHWWYEGPWFLAEVFRALHAQDAVLAVTPLEYLERHPQCEVAQPPLSSWGAKGYTDVWLNPNNDWICSHLDVAAERMVAMARAKTKPTSLEERALNQAVRELLLAQASDWPFIMTTGTAVEYATRRVRDHVARFTYLYEGLMGGGPLEKDVVRDLEAMDNLFPDLDYRVYR